MKKLPQKTSVVVEGYYYTVKITAELCTQYDYVNQCDKDSVRYSVYTRWWASDHNFTKSFRPYSGYDLNTLVALVERSYIRYFELPEKIARYAN